MDKKPVLLVVSFGTTHRHAGERAINAIETDLAAAFPAYEVRRAYTSAMVRARLMQRDGIHVDGVEEAVEEIVSEGVRKLLVQPTHVMKGYEYEKMLRQLMPYADCFDTIVCGMPLLDRPESYLELVNALASELPEPRASEAWVWMGHGTSHEANAVYTALEYVLHNAGYRHGFVGTVEGKPDQKATLDKVIASGMARVLLLPLLIVAGDHAVNDMAGSEADSWQQVFLRAGLEVECSLKGLGEYPAVRALFVRHAQDALKRCEA